VVAHRAVCAAIVLSLLTLSTAPTVGASVSTRGEALPAVEWADATVPGGWCGSTAPITLSDWMATITSSLNQDQTTAVVASKPSFGSIGGSIGEVAVLPVGCNNGGGTADGQLAFALVVFDGTRSSPHLFAVLTPRQPSGDDADHTPLLSLAKIASGRIVVREAWYGSNDPTCCSTGRATTTWALDNGRLKPSTVVRRQPSS